MGIKISELTEVLSVDTGQDYVMIQRGSDNKKIKAANLAGSSNVAERYIDLKSFDNGKDYRMILNDDGSQQIFPLEAFTCDPFAEGDNLLEPIKDPAYVGESQKSLTTANNTCLVINQIYGGGLGIRLLAGVVGIIAGIQKCLISPLLAKRNDRGTVNMAAKQTQNAIILAHQPSQLLAFPLGRKVMSTKHHLFVRIARHHLTNKPDLRGTVRAVAVLGRIKIDAKGIGKNKENISADKMITAAVARQLRPECLTVLLVVARDHHDRHTELLQLRDVALCKSAGIALPLGQPTSLDIPFPMVERIVTQKKNCLKGVLGVFLLHVVDEPHHSFLGRNTVPIKMAEVNIGCNQKSVS